MHEGMVWLVRRCQRRPSPLPHGHDFPTQTSEEPLYPYLYSYEWESWLWCWAREPAIVSSLDVSDFGREEWFSIRFRGNG